MLTERCSQGCARCISGGQPLEDAVRATFKRLCARASEWDQRFSDREEERRFKAELEPELLRWMLVGMVLAAVCTCFNAIGTFGSELFWGPGRRDLMSGKLRDIKTRVFLGQILLWTAAPLLLGALIAVRLVLGWLRSWNWEIIATGIMVYGSVVIVIGNTSHLTEIMGGDAGAVWQESVPCAAEAWVLLGLDVMTTAAAFFLPLRSVVMWVVPVVGVLSYIVMQLAIDTDDTATQLVVKILLLTALAYLSWHGAASTEKHLRTEWKAIQEVRKASEQISMQEVSILEKGREIELKEAEIKATTDLVRSLQTVTKALCDTMVHLSADLRICRSDTTTQFFEKEVEGLAFTDLLGKEDVARFTACVSRASMSHIPVCLPVTLQKKYTTCEAHLVLVDRGHTESRYLIGIRVEKDMPMDMDRRGTRGSNQGDALDNSPALPGAIPEKPVVVVAPPPTYGFCPVVPRPFHSIDEDDESDFSFTTYPKNEPPRPPKYTNFRARARTIRMILKRWNVPRDSESCCQYHTVLESIEEAVDCLRQQKCDPLWSTYPEQCPRCACMNQGPKCVVCGYVPSPEPPQRPLPAKGVR